jgi:glycine/D-amino acid oxidase-like deaminating enzyme
VKGTLVRVDIGGALPHNLTTSEVFSYNYYPPPEMYGPVGELPQDVYFYPRHDGLLLGGTRFESCDLDPLSPHYSDEQTTWRGDEWRGETVDIALAGGLAGIEPVPTPILSVNRDIILGLTGIDLDRFPKSALTGYRHKRSTVRLEKTESCGVQVIHNYGHGGAGVTLSWSCALDSAMRLLGRTVAVEEIQSLLARVMASS